MDSSSLSHTKWKCEYHIVFIPKYRRKVLYGKIKVDIRSRLFQKQHATLSGGMEQIFKVYCSHGH